jgi:hypothetical protein
MLMSAEDFAFELCPALGDAATEMKQLDIAIITVEDIKSVLRNRLIAVNNQRRETRVLREGATATFSTSKVQPFVTSPGESYRQSIAKTNRMRLDAINLPASVQLPLHSSATLPSQGINKRTLSNAVAAGSNTEVLPITRCQSAERRPFDWKKVRRHPTPRGSVVVSNQRCQKGSVGKFQLEATVHCYVKTEVLEIHEALMVVWEDDGSVADVLQCVRHSVRRIDADDLQEIYLATLEGHIQHLDKSCRLSSILSGGEELWAVQGLLQ